MARSISAWARARGPWFWLNSGISSENPGPSTHSPLPPVALGGRRPGCSRCASSPSRGARPPTRWPARPPADRGAPPAPASPPSSRSPMARASTGQRRRWSGADCVPSSPSWRTSAARALATASEARSSSSSAWRASRRITPASSALTSPARRRAVGDLGDPAPQAHAPPAPAARAPAPAPRAAWAILVSRIRSSPAATSPLATRSTSSLAASTRRPRCHSACSGRLTVSSAWRASSPCRGRA